ncbi:MAG TPA: hypothetical protein VIR33_14310 [Thermopolyspora sp.]|jgi:hypothetical protein
MSQIPTGPRRCGIPWCRQGHETRRAERTHLCDLGTTVNHPHETGASASLIALEVEQGVFLPPFVRLYIERPGYIIGDPVEYVDLPPDTAAFIGDLLAHIDLDHLPDLAGMLQAGADILTGDAR